jgi:hypothetical protein
MAKNVSPKMLLIVMDVRRKVEDYSPDLKKCQIRKCASQKGVENCAYCDEYACEKLKEFFVTEPDARERLDEIKSGL